MNILGCEVKKIPAALPYVDDERLHIPITITEGIPRVESCLCEEYDIDYSETVDVDFNYFITLNLDNYCNIDDKKFFSSNDWKLTVQYDGLGMSFDIDLTEKERTLLEDIKNKYSE